MLTPYDGMVLTQDTQFTPGVYALPNGIRIAADGITLDGNGALLVGLAKTGRGIEVCRHSRVTLKNLRLQEYEHGIFAEDCQELTIHGCKVSATAEIPANTDFLDVWRTAAQAYGSGILLLGCIGTRVVGNDLQHQMNGLLTYHCRNLVVQKNLANYCSGWGFHLYDTQDSLFEDNCADFCCRWQPRGERHGHMGADAAGFLILYHSSRNTFRRNLARMGGDGFFLGGLTPHFEAVPCNDNLFEENDGSWSPNIAFEATFSAGNIFRKNHANHCNYGFWLGFSSLNVIEENTLIDNARAGIAVENGFGFQVRRNLFQASDHGILLWSKHIPEFLKPVPHNTTSYDWTIEDNTFSSNYKAIRIAANQDHGIRPYPVPAGETPSRYRRPHDHLVRRNRFENNQKDIETVHADRTSLEENTFHGN